MAVDPINILLVDDRPANLLALEAVLRQPRYRLIWATSGAEAVQALAETEFAMILLDVQMPRMDGFETARRIREDLRHRDTPIIFITAINTEPMHISLGYDAGAIDYLTKPFDDHVLRSKVSVLADLYEKNRKIKKQQQEMGKINQQLLWEIHEREKAEADLKQAHRELEQRVRDRTAALASMNDALQSSLFEKEVMLKEIHHRVKNNLQVISSLLSLQGFEIEDLKLREIFRDSQTRIQAMALVHESLYQSKDLGKIDMDIYVRELVKKLLESHRKPSQVVEVQIRVEEGIFPLDTALPCGLILHELITNALKHAFRNGTGLLKISLNPQPPDRFRLSVEDNGVGMPEGFKLGQEGSLGLRIVDALVQQLRGKLEFLQEGGTRFSLTFPQKPVRQPEFSAI